MAKQLGFYFNANACTDCKACMAACKDKNDLPVGVNYRHVVKVVGGHWQRHPQYADVHVPSRVFSYALSISCMHCEEALCAEICPAAAITRNGDGILIIDPDKCIGCRYCEWACPYSGPQFNEEKGIMMKCDFCADLLAQGLNPACVDSCVMRALDFGDIDELKAKYGAVNAVEPMPTGDITTPSFVMTPHRDAELSSGLGARKFSSSKEGV